MPNPFFTMLSSIDFRPIGVAVLGGFAAMATVGVLIKGGTVILRKLGIGYFLEPEPDESLNWDDDVYRAAMQDLYDQKRSGVLLDRESAEALRD